jgi:hypothetical protein
MRFDIPKSSKKSQWSKTMKMVKSFWHIASLISLILFSPSWLEAACNTSDMAVDTSHLKPFSLIYSVNMRGNLLMIGNQNICRNTTNGAACQNPGLATASNNDYRQNFVNVDTTTTTTGTTTYPLIGFEAFDDYSSNKLAATPAIFNSSMMRLDLKSGDVIKWARLYWTGRNSEFHDCSNLTKNSEKAKTIKFRTPASPAYVNVVAEDNVSGYFIHPGAVPYADYGYSADVTALVQSGGAGEYYGANIITRTAKSVIEDIGDNSDPTATNYVDMYGSWVLMVVVENTSLRSLNNISVYAGYQPVDNHTATGVASSVTVNASGFLTPSSGAVKSNLFVYAGETDPIKPTEGSSDDQTTITNALGVATKLADGANTPNDVMNSSFYVNGVARSGSIANPSFSNLLGADMDVLTVSNLSNNQTSTNITINSQREYYTLNAFAFETALYEPIFCYDYTIKQDNHYLTIDRSNPLPRIVNQSISASPLELLIYLKNKEADIPANDLSIKADVNSTLFTYKSTDPMYVSTANGSYLADRGAPLASTNCTYMIGSGNALTDPGCIAILDLLPPYGVKDTLRLRKGNGQIGSNEYIFTKFLLQPTGINGALTTASEPLNLSLDYYITINGTNILYNDYPLGTTKIPMCAGSDSYTPIYGRFNIVERGSTLNNIKTQISRKPFDTDVIFDQTPTTGDNNISTSPVKTSVLVEIIYADTFQSALALCANPNDQTLPIYINMSSSSTGRTSVPSQTNDYYNMARKNAAFRVWMFTDSGDTLLNWTADTTNSGKTITKIYNLYNKDLHPACKSSCSDSSSTTCFTCIKNNYAKPICSRDNFSIRPEAFDIRIDDVNQTTLTKKLQLVSLKAGYTPSSTVPTARMNLAAGYAYGYDINATGHDASTYGFKGIPGYNGDFNGSVGRTFLSIPDFNSSVIQSNCNDLMSKNVTASIKEGSLSNFTALQSQVGEYRITMSDSSWTTVDQLVHTVTSDNGFYSGPDCTLGSNSTTDTAGALQGCTISSAHTQGTLIYKDQKIQLHPYKINLSGLNYILPTSAASGERFIYDANLSNSVETNMSVQAMGQIQALGADNGVLSNFVTGCYAQDVNLSIDHNATTTLALPFVYRAFASTIKGVQSFDSGVKKATNARVINTTIGKSNFAKVDKGAVVSTVKLNFDRSPKTPLDPQIVRYRDINGSCPTCSYSADGVTKSATGTIARDLNVTHVYGRIGTQDIRASQNKPFSVPAYYEVYHAPTLLGQPLTVDRWDNNWYINKLHATESKDGSMSVSFVLTGGTLPTGSTYDAQGTKTYNFQGYATTGAYIGHIKTSPWLWYGGSSALNYLDPLNPSRVNCATHPCFNIVVGGMFGSSGSAQTGSETTKGNKKSGNSGTWHSTSDYSPAIR